MALHSYKAFECREAAQRLTPRKPLLEYIQTCLISASVNMTRWTFDQVRSVFIADVVLETFNCIANPHSRDCPNPLWPERLDDAAELFRQAEYDRNIDELRNLINCLLCVEHQSTYTHKNKVEARWGAEFPQFDFSRRRSPSPYSLKSGRRTGRLSRTPSPSFTASTPPPQPVFRTPSREGNTGAADPIHTPQSSRSSFLAVPAYDSDDGGSSAVSDSPLLRRRTAQAEDSQSVQATSQSTVESPRVMDVVAEMIDPPEIGVVEGICVAEMPVESEHNGEEDAPSDPQVPLDFRVGEAVAWAPWTLRSEVVSTLLEPLPKANSKGTIYAVRVKDTPYLKIGYTIRKSNTRWTEISRRDNVDLETEAAFTRRGIPYLQLLRLEALVHADLAYFRRNLRTKNGKYSREYFEVDIATAQRSINTWLRVMQDVRLEPGRELSDEMCNQIETAASYIETSDDQITPTPAEHWPEVNANHALREGAWTAIFRLDQGGVRKSTSTAVPAKVAAGTVLWLLSGTLDQPTQAIIAVSVILAFTFSHWTFW